MPPKSKDYHRQYRARKRVEDPDFDLKATLNALYGLSIYQYRGMLDDQGGVCAACFAPPPPGRRLQVDHDHATGHVRGLLCHACNVALGCVRDDYERLYRLIDYLARTTNRRLRDAEARIRRQSEAEARRQKQRPLKFGAERPRKVGTND